MNETPDGIHRDRTNGDNPDGDHANSDDEASTEDDPGWPISFLLLVGAGALYLVLRFFDMIKSLVT